MPVKASLLAIVLLAGAGGAAATRPSPDTFTNPLLPGGPDPSIVRDGSVYYYMHTLGDRLEILRTRDITDLAHAERRVVWRPSPPADNGHSIWAPELHRIDGRWYIYYTATRTGHDDDAHRGIFVLENASGDPLTGDWIDRGRLATAHPGIDGTTFAHRGRRYFVYSPYVGADSDLAIVAMRDPVTLTGPETIIAVPDRPWERRGGRQILEGPAVVAAPNGDLYLSYSASACWSDDYALGLLHAPADGDLLDARSWRKAPRPVLATSAKAGVYAPGHNGFFDTPGGQTWIVYHANSGPGMKCTSRRSPRIQRVTWQGGRPVFAPPAGDRQRLAKPR
jgi:GH43 family beta-xylosidase